MILFSDQKCTSARVRPSSSECWYTSQTIATVILQLLYSLNIPIILLQSPNYFQKTKNYVINERETILHFHSSEVIIISFSILTSFLKRHFRTTSTTISFSFRLESIIKCIVKMKLNSFKWLVLTNRFFFYVPFLIWYCRGRLFWISVVMQSKWTDILTRHAPKIIVEYFHWCWSLGHSSCCFCCYCQLMAGQNREWASSLTHNLNFAPAMNQFSEIK